MFYVEGKQASEDGFKLFYHEEDRKINGLGVDFKLEYLNRTKRWKLKRDECCTEFREEKSWGRIRR